MIETLFRLFAYHLTADVNKDPLDEFKSYLKIIEIEAEGKTIDTPCQTYTRIVGFLQSVNERIFL